MSVICDFDASMRERPRIRADRDHDGRWLVEHQGHCYVFPRWDSAVTAALKPRVLCCYACICPVRGRESR